MKRVIFGQSFVEKWPPQCELSVYRLPNNPSGSQWDVNLFYTNKRISYQFSPIRYVYFAKTCLFFHRLIVERLEFQIVCKMFEKHVLTNQWKLSFTTWQINSSKSDVRVFLRRIILTLQNIQFITINKTIIISKKNIKIRTQYSY